jgi:hypothetical protein
MGLEAGAVVFVDAPSGGLKAGGTSLSQITTRRRRRVPPAGLLVPAPA